MAPVGATGAPPGEGATPFVGPAPGGSGTPPGRIAAGAMRGPGIVGLVAALLLLHGALSFWSATRESATFDEVAHIGAGYSHLVTGDRRLDQGQPPLPKLLAALALRPLDPPLPLADWSWRICNYWRFGRIFLYEGGRGREMLLAARAPFLALSLLLGLLVFGWARETWGTRGGLLALFLWALNPEMLAHSHYANSDLALALFFSLYLWGYARFLAAPGLAHGAWAAGSFALAAVTKFSFATLLPISLAMAAVAIARRGAREGARPAGRLVARLSALAAAGLLVSWIAIWAFHGLRAQAAVTPGLSPAFSLEEMLPDGSRAKAVLLRLRDDEWLPEAYATGLGYMVFTPGEQRYTYLAGRARDGGTWAYFPVALLLKTPLPLLLLAGIAAFLPGRLRPPGADPRFRFLLPAVLYFGIAVAYGYNIGYRHLLPVLPLLMALAGGAALLPLRARRLKAAGAAVLLWVAAGTLQVAPHFLSYFNELAGGPRGGSRWLADSNCDWGQDLDALGRWCRKNGVARLKLSYFGTASPAAAGIDCELLPSIVSGWTDPPWARRVAEGDVVAFSVTQLRRVYAADPGAFPLEVRLPGAPARMGFGSLAEFIERNYRPAGRAGYSILIYRLVPEHRRE